MVRARCLAALLPLLSGTAGPAAGQAAPGEGADKVCPMIYQPVCAARDGEAQTFPNACIAEAAGFTVSDAAPCAAETASEPPQRRLVIEPN